MSEIRAKLLDFLIQRSTQEAEVKREPFLDCFSARHCVERSTADTALADLLRLGLVETTPFTVSLTRLTKRLSN